MPELVTYFDGKPKDLKGKVEIARFPMDLAPGVPSAEGGDPVNVPADVLAQRVRPQARWRFPSVLTTSGHSGIATTKRCAS